MNYYNPYLYAIPSTVATPKVGLFSRLFGNSGITLSSIINGTQRALNFANQTIPLVKQVKPMIGNAKTMFKVMNEFKRTEIPKQNNVQNNKNTNTNLVNNKKIINDKEENNKTINENINEGPTFFI